MSGIATAVALLAQLYVGVAARPQLPSPRVGVAARPQLPSPRVGVATSRAQEVKLNFDPKARLPVDFKLAAVSRNSAGKL